MVVLLSTGASRYRNCCIDGDTSPENFRYHLVYKTVVQNLLLHVSALHGCHNQGVFRVVKVVLSKRSVVRHTVHICSSFEIVSKHTVKILLLKY